MSRRWMGGEHSVRAAELILDAATELFVREGVSKVGMGEVARAAGCSRQTLYRYFESRQALHLAFAHREALRLVTHVAAEVESIPDPAEQLVATMVALLREVRSTEHLAAWFREGESDLTSGLVNSSPVIEALALSFFTRNGHGAADARTTQLTRWCIRVILSLLITPGADDDDERELLEQFVAPLVEVAMSSDGHV